MYQYYRTYNGPDVPEEIQSVESVKYNNSSRETNRYSGTVPDDHEALTQLASGLSFIHSTNLVHRDLKPENILISTTTEGHVLLKIADFGFCKQTIEGSFDYSFPIKCTWLGLAPELMEFWEKCLQERRDTAQHRCTIQSDIWAMGSVMFYFLSRGHLAFGGNIDSPYNMRKGNPVTLNRESCFIKHCIGNVRDLIRK